jgi:hypothetical protein
MKDQRLKIKDERSKTKDQSLKVGCVPSKNFVTLQLLSFDL